MNIDKVAEHVSIYHNEALIAATELLCDRKFKIEIILMWFKNSSFLHIKTKPWYNTVSHGNLGNICLDEVGKFLKCLRKRLNCSERLSTFDTDLILNFFTYLRLEVTSVGILLQERYQESTFLSHDKLSSSRQNL